jgi:hypothetical protein
VFIQGIWMVYTVLPLVAICIDATVTHQENTIPIVTVVFVCSRICLVWSFGIIISWRGTLFDLYAKYVVVVLISISGLSGIVLCVLVLHGIDFKWWWPLYLIIPFNSFGLELGAWYPGVVGFLNSRMWYYDDGRDPTQHREFIFIPLPGHRG